HSLVADDAERRKGSVVVQHEEPVGGRGGLLPETLGNFLPVRTVHEGPSGSITMRSCSPLWSARISVRYSRRWRVSRKFSRTNRRPFSPIAAVPRGWLSM